MSARTRRARSEWMCATLPHSLTLKARTIGSDYHPFADPTPDRRSPKLLYALRDLDLPIVLIGASHDETYRDYRFGLSSFR